MKIISLLGSPHGLNGNTAWLLKIVLEGTFALGQKLVDAWKNNERPADRVDIMHAFYDRM